MQTSITVEERLSPLYWQHWCTRTHCNIIDNTPYQLLYWWLHFKISKIFVKPPGSYVYADNQAKIPFILPSYLVTTLLPFVQVAQSFKSGLNEKPSDADNLLSAVDLACSVQQQQLEVTRYNNVMRRRGGGTDVRRERSCEPGPRHPHLRTADVRLESAASPQLTAVLSDMTADYTQSADNSLVLWLHSSLQRTLHDSVVLVFFSPTCR